MKYLAAYLLLSTATALIQPAATVEGPEEDMFDMLLISYGLTKFSEGQSAAILEYVKNPPQRISRDEANAMHELAHKLIEDDEKGLVQIDGAIASLNKQRWGDESTRRHCLKITEKVKTSAQAAIDNWQIIANIAETYQR